jgi:hypothetical protein
MEVEAVPEEGLVEILAPKGSDEPLDERMRALPNVVRIFGQYGLADINQQAASIKQCRELWPDQT